MSNIDMLMLKFTEANIIHQFSNMNDYYNELSLMIKSEKQRIFNENEKLQKKLEYESDDKKEQYSDKYADDWYIIGMLEHTFCNSITISIYTLIEKYINEICESLRKYKNIPITYKDLRDDGILRAKYYIEKLGGLIFDTNDSSFLSGFNAIRNIIAHENGELYNSQEKTINKILNISRQAPGCKINHDIDINDKGEKINIYHNIELDFNFVEYCLEHGKIIFRNIFSQL
jgi:hypothetical protein